MRRSLFFGLLLILMARATWAQDAAFDPAAYIPANTPLYLEAATTDDGLQQLAALERIIYETLGGTPPVDVGTDTLYPFLNAYLPMFSSDDILSWVGDHAALAYYVRDDGTLNEWVFVLPIGDEAGAGEFLASIRDNAIEVEPYGSFTRYFVGVYTVLRGSSVIWIGSPEGMNTLMSAPPESLAQTAGYQRVRASLPADAPIKGYIDGAWLQSQIAAGGAQGNPSFGAIAETFLRLHPVQSAFKTALLEGATIDGFGFGISAGVEQLDVDLTFALDAEFDTPDAPLSLAHYAPADSFFVANGYDVTTLSVVGGIFGGLLAPVRVETFSNISGGDAPATPTPTPTPVPVTATDLIAQVQPIITQGESLAGLSLDELYGLINGEYLLALFPGEDGTTGAALWIESNAPLRVIEALEQVSKLVLINPDGQPFIPVERTTVDGVTIALIGTPGIGERLAVGAFDPMLFVTSENLVPQVIAAASDEPAAWESAFEGGQNFAFSLDPRTLDRYVSRFERTPPLPITRIDGELAISDDGIFTLHVTGTVGE